MITKHIHGTETETETETEISMQDMKDKIRYIQNEKLCHVCKYLAFILSTNRIIL